jgi:hypothetical protein
MNRSVEERQDDERHQVEQKDPDLEDAHPRVVKRVDATASR